MVNILLRSSKNEPSLGNEQRRNNGGAVGDGVFYAVSAGRLHIEMVKERSFRTFINIYSLFKSESLSSQIILSLHEALIMSVMTYVCPAWVLAAYIYLFKLQRVQNKVLRTTGNFPRCRPVRVLNTTFNLPYVNNYITNFCRKQSEVI
jgi:hypothetical protein